MESFNPEKIKKAEIIVGIPSFNESKTIGFVVEQVSLGLEKYFPNKKTVIVNLDNDSPDKTKQSFLKAKGNIPKIYISTPKGIKGKGCNFHNLFLMVKKMDANVGISVDADLRSISPDWIKKMVEPILNGYDFVSPYYSRCWTDGTITNQIVFPLVYGLLGWNIRQPIGGDFAFSNKVAGLWLEKKWLETTYQFGIDIFMTLNVLFSKLKTCQVNLGSKAHSSSAPKLGPMFFQVVETFFNTILDYQEEINNKDKVENLEILGGKKLPVFTNNKSDVQLFRELFLDSFDSYWDLIKNTVSHPVEEKLALIHQNKQGEIDLELWLKIVYDFLHAYKIKENKSSIIEALGCLYFGRVASFFEQTIDLTSDEVEKKNN
ncbi:MAG: glycosyltransferase [bacterium]